MKPKDIKTKKRKNKMKSLSYFFLKDSVGQPFNEQTYDLYRQRHQLALEHALRAGWFEE